MQDCFYIAVKQIHRLKGVKFKLSNFLHFNIKTVAPQYKKLYLYASTKNLLINKAPTVIMQFAMLATTSL